ncbi:hypothetical protein [Algoriphagus antarcticus]|uniref:HTH-type transcriptional regulator/antitoxin HigA n=1 Tax=Algoriphagus antarcticus TaxID=238540 RepID=A0A3E0EC28_9BACT|nr:hypothetical protein [Algoriphagus antarcticus]REG94566.1 hypothetical protein C8N25_101398 [Algoriphagus antarcticus]
MIKKLAEKKITNDQEYETAMKWLNPIFNADPESPEGIEAEQLVNLITEFEIIHYPHPEKEVKKNTSEIIFKIMSIRNPAPCQI